MDEKTKTKKEGVISHEKKTHVNLLYLKYICISCGELGISKTFWKIETTNAIFWMYLGGTA